MSALRDMASALGVVSSSSSVPTLQRASVEDQIAADIAGRIEDFALADALKMPSVRRAIDLIVSIGSSFTPRVYRNGVPVEVPRIIAKPDPFRSRDEFVAMTIRSLIAEGDGNAYWRIGEGYAMVLDPADVSHYYTDERKLETHYEWQGQELRLGVDILHLRIGQKAGYLEGKGPLGQCLDQLAILWAQEQFARYYFEANGTPHTILSADGTITGEEAAAMRSAWVTARGQSGVGVLGGGLKASFPDNNPENAQLTDSRTYANTVVSTLLGIPGPLMNVELAGSSLQYQNVSQLTQSLSRQTILPLYLAPIEAAQTELLSRTHVVEYSVQELVRVDVATRVDVYEKLLAMGVVTAEQVALAMGLDPGNVPESSTDTQLTPQPRTT